MSRPKLKAPCADCGIDTLEPGPNWYMVHDDLWRTAWPTAGTPLRVAVAGVDAGGQYDFGFERFELPAEILCMRCLELRLGRPLTAADFTNVPVNDHIRKREGA
jgi:hypothetical protein